MYKKFECWFCGMSIFVGLFNADNRGAIFSPYSQGESSWRSC